MEKAPIRSNMSKPLTITFTLDARILALIYICYKYKFPLSFLLSFYEMYGHQALFILKAMSCAGKIKLTDSTFIKILEESQLLHKQIIKGITTNIKRNKLINQVKSGRLITEMIPECPAIALKEFSDDFSQFITQYLQKNIKNLFCDQIELHLNTVDLYSEICK